MILLGVGTGRSGTVSLSRLLSESGGIEVTHESRSAGLRPLPWMSDASTAIAHVESVLESLPAVPVVGDVASFYLPHLDTLCRHFDDVLVVHLVRDSRQVADSFMRKTIARNLWQEHRGFVHRRDPVWEPAFPKADPRLTKRDAILWYCDLYEREMEAFEATGVAPVFTVETEDLACQQTLDELAASVSSRSGQGVTLRPLPASNPTVARRRRWIPDSARYLRMRIRRRPSTH